MPPYWCIGKNYRLNSILINHAESCVRTYLVPRMYIRAGQGMLGRYCRISGWWGRPSTHYKKGEGGRVCGRGDASAPFYSCFQNWSPLYVQEAVESVGTPSRLMYVTFVDVVRDSRIPMAWFYAVMLVFVGNGSTIVGWPWYKYHSSLSRIDIDVRTVRWWRGYRCMRDCRYIVPLSVERYGSDHQLCEIKTIGTCLLPVSPTPTASTLWRSLLTT